MNILAIDTSTKTLSLAVGKGPAAARFRNTKLKRPLSSSIMPGIKRILNASELTLEQIDLFAVGLGPGSFTGLRVGLATVKGLAFAVGKPVVGISSLDLIAMNIEEDGQICVLCDAKRNQVYACVYSKDGSGLVRQSDYLLAPVQDVLKKIEGRVIFSGDGVELFAKDIKNARHLQAQTAKKEDAFPQAKHLISIAAERYQRGETDDIGKLVPLYLYPEHCQVRKSAAVK